MIRCDKMSASCCFTGDGGIREVMLLLLFVWFFSTGNVKSKEREEFAFVVCLTGERAVWCVWRTEIFFTLGVRGV